MKFWRPFAKPREVVAGSEEQSPVSPPRWTRRKVIVALLLLVVIAGLLRRPVLGGIRDWRFASLVEKVEVALQDDDPSEAQRNLGAALRLKSSDLSAIRTLLPLAEEIRSPDLLTIAWSQFAHPEATWDDRLAVMKLGLRRNDLVLVGHLYEQLSDAEREDPRAQLVFAIYQGRTGKVFEALELAEQLRDSPHRAEASATMVELLSGLPSNPVAAQRVRKLVAELIAGNDPHALEAFRHLSRLPAQERILDAELDLAAWLDKQADAEAADRLLVGEISFAQVAPEQRMAHLKKLVVEMRGHQVGAVSRLLLEPGKRDYLKKMPRAFLRTEEAAYLAYLQALLDEGRFAETRDWLQDPHPDLNAVVLHSVRAGLALKTDQGTAAVQEWIQAFKEAKIRDNYGAYFGILLVAERFEDRKTMKRACREISRLPLRKLPATRQLTFLDRVLGEDPEFLEEMHTRIHAGRKSDPVAILNLALVQLMQGTKSVLHREQLATLARSYPGYLELQCVLALALSEEGHPERAREVFASLEIDWNGEVSAFSKATYALVLRRSGERRRAVQLERSIMMATLPAYQRDWFLSHGLGAQVATR